MADNITIPKLIDNVDKYFQYEGSANPTTQDELQAFMKNEHSVVACLTKKLWQPETAYEIGQIVESPNMPVGFSAVALVNGISYSNEPDWGNGTEDVTDGSMKWHLTKGNVTVNGVAPDDSGNITINKISSASNADNATKATNDSSGQQINTTYVKSVSGNANTLTITKGDGTNSTVNIATPINIPGQNFYVSGSQQGYRELWSYNIWFNTYDYSGNCSGSGPVDKYLRCFITDSGVGSGTYTLQNLLQQLVNKSHTHRTWERHDKTNCNCDCNCGDSDS